MTYFNLPISSIVNRFIPKNAFDEFTNAKQRKKLTDTIDRVTWLNKISKETINLLGKDILEIQIFELKLKEQVFPKDLLDIIDRSIPYPILFVLTYGDLVMFSTTKKHEHPLNKDNAVLDWNFTTEWHSANEIIYRLNLKISLDFIYADFCAQLANYIKQDTDIASVIEFDKNVKNLNKQIVLLRNAISTEKQFNKKVEINLQLNKYKKQLDVLLNV